MPAEYHCHCNYCAGHNYLGELRPADKTYYNRLDRRKYYSPIELASLEAGHIAKTPLHIARWAIQSFTRKGDWVLDPTAGAGTTLVEAIHQNRNAVGVEIEFIDVIKENVSHALTLHPGALSAVIHGDARNITDLLYRLSTKSKFALIVNNPPYWGDQSQYAIGGERYSYDTSRANLAFLKEGTAYWETIEKIYADCVKHLKKGGYFVIGVKDQMRNKKSDQLHEKFADLLTKRLALEYIGTALLKHYPTTLHLNTYEKRTGVKPPLYQSILVAKKP